MADRLAIPGAVTSDVRDFSGWMMAEQRRVFLLCFRMLQDKDEADSATQDVFLKAYRALQKQDAQKPDEPGKWLTRIAVNTCLDTLRSRQWKFWRRRPSQEDEELILSNSASGRPSAEDLLFAQQIDDRIGVALKKLSLRQRAVFTLRHYEDCSLDQIAEILSLDVGTVKAHMFRAINKMREELKELYEKLPAR